MLDSKHQYLNNVLGFSLIELMVALTLSLLILMSLSTIYLAASKNHLSEAALQNIQQNARIAFQLIQGAIRIAGNVGCAALQDDFPVTTSEPYNITKNNRIHDYRGSEIKGGTDAFTVRYADAVSGLLIEPMQLANIIHMTGFPKIKAGDVLLISDCETAEMITVEQVSSSNDETQIIMTDKNLTKVYKENAEVSVFEMNAFYIGKTDRKDSKGAPIYALYMKDKASHKTELVEGISEMQIRYVVLQNGGISEERSEEVNDWSAVVGVSLQLVFESLNDFSLKKTGYTYVALRER
jgi:type IV pilus assembly protein PilW